MKEQEAKGISSIYYQIIYCLKCDSIDVYKMNNIVNKFLSA